MDVTEAQVDRLARLTHERFRSQVAEGSSSDVAFDRLSPELRDVNRASARAIPGHLEALGLGLAPSGGAQPTVDRFSDDEVERLARREHERWISETLARGYRHGAVRDDVARTHPDLVPWEALDEAARDKDRELMRAIPDLVAAVDMVIVEVRS